MKYCGTTAYTRPQDPLTLTGLKIWDFQHALSSLMKVPEKYIVILFNQEHPAVDWFSGPSREIYVFLCLDVKDY